ncbi:TPA: hypothetical protein ACIN5E_000180 [Streptococcus agalactiae]
MSERGKPRAWKQSNANEVLNGKMTEKKQHITVLYLGESGGTVPMKRK